MALYYTNPVDYSILVNNYITGMKSKNDYLKSIQPATKSKKTPGDKLFDPEILKAHKYRLDLSHYTKILESSLLSEQERKFYLLQKFMLEMADADYQQVSDITTLFTINAQHIAELLAHKKDGKENKLIFLVPNSEKSKSNFWLSLFFIELTRGILTPNYCINDTIQIDKKSIYDSTFFQDSYNYIVVITDDISYSGEQLSKNTFLRNNPKILSKHTLFFNLVGYSEIALDRITRAKGRSECNLVFARGAKHPLNKLSAKFEFNAATNTNNVLYQKSLIDFTSPAQKIGTRMLSTLLLNDVFYISKSSSYSSSNIEFKSKLFNYYQFWETPRKTENNNGSIQYLPIKYPDEYSTVENMCKFYRLQNVAILRFDRLIHYVNLPGQTDEEKLDWIANKIIEKNLYDDTITNIQIKYALIEKFIEKSQGINTSPDWPIQLNSFDNKFISIFTSGGVLSGTNELDNILQKFNHNYNDKSFNNQLLNKFVNLNNKISKFNKKHMLEFVMPKSQYLLKHSSKYLIKNCGSNVNEPYDKTVPYCNVNCSLNFYRYISWD